MPPKTKAKSIKALQYELTELQKDPTNNSRKIEALTKRIQNTAAGLNIDPAKFPKPKKTTNKKKPAAA